jgi:hypothetical protein
MRSAAILSAILLMISVAIGSVKTAPEVGPRADGAAPVQSPMQAPMQMGSPDSKDPATPAQMAFENLKKLVGRWEAPMGNNAVIVDTFQMFAFDTAILAQEWVGGQQITSTVFYMVGSELRADHYCDYKNQPRYVAKVSSDPATIDFEFREATNLDTHPIHFHSTTWHLIDAAHMVQEWHVEGSSKGNSTIHLDFVRTSSGQPTADPASLQRTRPSVGLVLL